jgi:hypothetical protein
MKKVLYIGVLVLAVFMMSPAFAQDTGLENDYAQEQMTGDKAVTIVENLLDLSVTVQVTYLDGSQSDTFVVEPGASLTKKFLKGTTVDILEGAGQAAVDTLVAYEVGDEKTIKRTTTLTRNVDDQLIDVTEIITVH